LMPGEGDGGRVGLGVGPAHPLQMDAEGPQGADLVGGGGLRDEDGDRDPA